jgi:uncharacterized phosphosugar-binding protein
MKSTPRLKSKQRLIDVVDIAIDTHVPYGDASIEVPGLDAKIAPVSTIANVTIVQSIMAEAVEILVKEGFTPPIRISRNTPEGDEHNSRIIPQYIDRIPELR